MSGISLESRAKRCAGQIQIHIACVTDAGAVARRHTGSNCGGFSMAEFFSIQWRRAITTVALVFAFGTVAVAQERRFYSPPELSTVRAVPAERGMLVAQEKLAAQ